jgi:hypothetical protein
MGERGRYKTVWVSPETHERLWLLRVRMRARSLDEVIRMLIEQCGQEGRVLAAHAAR